MSRGPLGNIENVAVGVESLGDRTGGVRGIAGA